MNARLLAVSPADVAAILDLERRELARELKRRRREHLRACIAAMPPETRDEDACAEREAERVATRGEFL